MKLTIKNIGILAGIDESGRDRIAGADMARLEVVENAYLTAEEGLIASYGRMEELPEGRADEEIDARGGVVLPAFCDSHTHIVYAGSREGEFVDKINGLSYEEIARVLDINVGTIKSRISRGREKLREKFQAKAELFDKPDV